MLPCLIIRCPSLSCSAPPDHALLQSVQQRDRRHVRVAVVAVRVAKDALDVHVEEHLCEEVRGGRAGGRSGVFIALPARCCWVLLVVAEDIMLLGVADMVTQV